MKTIIFLVNALVLSATAAFADSIEEQKGADLTGISAEHIAAMAEQSPEIAVAEIEKVSVAVNANDQVGGDIGAVKYRGFLKEGGFLDDGVLYPLRDCLSAGNNSIAFHEGPKCAASLMTRAEEVKDSVLQAAVAMKRLDDYADTYYINPGIHIARTSPLGLARHVGGKFLKNSAERGELCELLGISDSCDVWASRDMGKPDPNADRRFVVSVPHLNSYESNALDGTILEMLAGGSLDKSTMVYDPRKGEFSAAGSYEALQSLSAHVRFHNLKYGYQFERRMDSPKSKAEVFRVLKTLSNSRIGEGFGYIGDLVEHVILHPDGSLDYKYGLVGIKMAGHMPEYEIAVSIKDGKIVAVNLEGLAGMVKIEQENQNELHSDAVAAEAWIADLGRRLDRDIARQEAERAKEAAEAREEERKYNSPEAREERIERLLRENKEALEKQNRMIEEERTRPNGFKEGVGAFLFGEEYIRDAKRKGKEIRWF